MRFERTRSGNQGAGKQREWNRPASVRQPPVPMTIRAILFDLGGVFFPWPSPEFFAAWERRFGLEPGRLHALLWYGPDIEAANIGQMSADEYVARCAARLGAEEALARELIETAFYAEEPNRPLVSFTRTLRSHFTVVALTNTWSFGRQLLQRRRCAELFDLIVSSADEGVRKPDPRIYQLVLDRLSLTPAEVLFVDDSEENIEAARTLGIRGVHFVSTEGVIAELQALLRLAEGIEPREAR